MTMRVGFCGLGVMGAPMAGHLARAGRDVLVHNRTPSRALEWVASHGGRAVPTPRELAAECEIVFLCVGNDDDVRQVMLADEGVLAGARPGTIVVDHTTTSAQLARDMHQSCAAHGVGYVDAPVSGGQAGAEAGQLSVMCGSVDPATFEAVAPVIAAYAKLCRRMGGVGAGQLTKMVNQMCIAGTLAGVSEALVFARNAGLDGHEVVDVVSGGAAQSWQLVNRGHTMVDREFDFGFAIEWMIKDLRYCVEEAGRVDVDTPVAAMVLAMYEELAARGLSRSDTSALIVHHGD